MPLQKPSAALACTPSDRAPARANKGNASKETRARRVTQLRRPIRRGAVRDLDRRRARQNLQQKKGSSWSSEPCLPVFGPCLSESKSDRLRGNPLILHGFPKSMPSVLGVLILRLNPLRQPWAVTSMPLEGRRRQETTSDPKLARMCGDAVNVPLSVPLSKVMHSIGTRSPSENRLCLNG